LVVTVSTRRTDATADLVPTFVEAVARVHADLAVVDVALVLADSRGGKGRKRDGQKDEQQCESLSHKQTLLSSILVQGFIAVNERQPSKLVTSSR
jgi:hypothetical protein